MKITKRKLKLLFEKYLSEEFGGYNPDKDYIYYDLSQNEDDENYGQQGDMGEPGYAAYLTDKGIKLVHDDDSVDMIYFNEGGFDRLEDTLFNNGIEIEAKSKEQVDMDAAEFDFLYNIIKAEGDLYLSGLVSSGATEFVTNEFDLEIDEIAQKMEYFKDNRYSENDKSEQIEAAIIKINIGDLPYCIIDGKQYYLDSHYSLSNNPPITKFELEPGKPVNQYSKELKNSFISGIRIKEVSDNGEEIIKDYTLKDDASSVVEKIYSVPRSSPDYTSGVFIHLDKSYRPQFFKVGETIKSLSGRVFRKITKVGIDN